jgi:membrane-associated phospholipid phosphatase
MFKREESIFFIVAVIGVVVLYQYGDREIATYFYQMKNSGFRNFFHFITRFGKSEWYLIPSILLFWYFRKKGNREYAKMAWYIFITNVVAGIGVWFIKIPFGRARPELYLQDNIYGFEWFEIHHKLTSFPSGHTVTVISSTVALSLLFPRLRYILIPFGIAVAFSRVVGTQHYISDVLFGLFLGTLVAIVLFLYSYKNHL